MPDRKGIVIADKLNVRSGSETDFPVVCQLVQGTQVDIQRQIGDWKELNLNNLEGYVNRVFIALNLPDSIENKEINYGIVEADTLNIRSGPGYEFHTVAITRKGELVEIIEERQDWYQIKTRRLNGFIMNHLVVEVIGGGPISGGLYLAAVNEEFVNLRSGPGLNYAVIAVLPKNKEVKVQGAFDGWVQIETIPNEGYIRKDFVKKTMPAGSTADEPNIITFATVKTDLLNLRTGPDEKYSTLAYLNSGTQLKVKDVATNWLRVQPMIQSAYVFGKYIKEISAEAPIEIPGLQDPLKPPTIKTILIQDHFSAEQKTMANTWNQYGGLIQQISSQISIDPTVALAVLSVESGGKGFAADGRMIIRFENHYFYHYWGSIHEDQYNRHFKFNADKTWKGHQYRISTSSSWQDVHTGYQKDEWQVFEFASQFDGTAALKSISMGSPQIMGANHHLIGYSTVEQMYHEFQSDMRHQIWGLFRFIEAKNLMPDLIAEDFIAFAKVYNGPARTSTYGNKIRLYVDEFRQIAHLGSENK